MTSGILWGPENIFWYFLEVKSLIGVVGPLSEKELG